MFIAAGSSYFHTGVPLCILDKDVRNKNHIIKTAAASKVEKLDDDYNNAEDIQGLSE